MPRLENLALGSAALLSVLAVSCEPTTPPVVNTNCPSMTTQAMKAAPVSLLTAQAVSATSTPAPSAPTPDWQAPHVPGEVLVLPGAAALSAQSLPGIRAQQVAGGILLASTPAGQSDQAFASSLEARGLTTQPNFIYAALDLPNDPGFPGNAGVTVQQNSGQKLTAFQDYLTITRVPAAWAALQRCGRTVTGAAIGVVDTAVDSTHPELAGQVTAQGTFRSAANGYQVFDHGTAAAGIMNALSDNAAGISGVAWNPALITEDTIGSSGTTTTDVIHAVQDAVSRGARVINLSLGMKGNPGDAALDQALKQAAQSAVLVAAAGNTASDGIYYPASEPEVVAVGAVTQAATALTCYSGRPAQGSTRLLDIVAPGGDGAGYCAGAAAPQDLLVLAPGGGYALKAGTSFAAPQVSAVAALMRAANPSLTAAQTKTLLLGSVNKANGLPMLDAGAAVRAALGVK